MKQQEHENATPADSQGQGLAARRAALDILERTGRGTALEDALVLTRTFCDLEGSDRRFARALASTVLRRRGSLDHVLGAYLARPLARRAVRIMDILRLCAAQTLFLSAPAHAVVSTAVELAGERRETAGYGKLVNAVARKVCAAGPGVLEKLPPRTDTPAWLWRSWERAYGPVRTRAIAGAHTCEAPLDLTLKNPAEADMWAERLRAEITPSGGLRLPSPGHVPALEGFEEGAWWVQDTAAALVAGLFGDVRGMRIFDLCAAPGGKTLQLAAAGAHVTAIDRSGHRLKRLAENLERTGLKAQLVKDDTLNWSPKGKAGGVLLDAPCTATGTIRRHPDIPWGKNEGDVDEMARRQAQMLSHALTLLAPGGMLVYAVCSLQPQEGERQVEDVLEGNTSLSRIPVRREEAGGLGEAVTPRGDLRTLPSMLADRGGMDGFYAARLKYAP